MFLKKKIQQILYIFKNQGIDTSLSSLCQFSCSSALIGHHFLMCKLYSGKYKLKFIFEIFKNFITANKTSSLLVIKNKNINKYNFTNKNIFVSWAKKKDFDEKGNYLDSYTNINSKYYPNTIFLIIYEEKLLPKFINNNIVLFKLKYHSLYFLILTFPYNIIKQIIYYKFNIIKLLHYFNFQSQFAILFCSEFFNQFKEIKIKKIFFPYEGQPFQNYLIKKLRQSKKIVKSIGYISHMHAIPSDATFREGSPDILLLHSRYQKNILREILFWKNKNLKLIKSLRLKKTNFHELTQKIYIPYKINNFGLIVKKFEKFIKKSKKNSLPKFEIKLHPRPYNKNIQNKLKNKFLKILDRYQYKLDKKSYNKKISIVIGTSTTIFYLLDHKISVIHFHDSSIFEKLNKYFWTNINISKINNFISNYKILKNKNCIIYENKITSQKVNFLS